jgi:hypothetical protein
MMLLKKAGSAGKAVLAHRLKPKFEPLLAGKGLAWTDFYPILNEIDTIEELHSALESPEAFLAELSKAAGPVGKKMFVLTLKPVLEPVLEEEGLEWKDMQPILNKMDSVEELQLAVDDPAAIFEKLLMASSPAGKRLLVLSLKPALEPVLKEQGLEWLDVQPVLNELESVDELRKAAVDVTGFLQGLMERTGPVARKMLVLQLRPKLEPVLEEQSLKWLDVQPVLNEIDSMDELRKAAADVGSFLQGLTESAGPVAQKMLFLQLQSKLEPVLKEQGLEWSDAEVVLKGVKDVNELRRVIDDVGTFVVRLQEERASQNADLKQPLLSDKNSVILGGRPKAAASKTSKTSLAELSSPAAVGRGARLTLGQIGIMGKSWKKAASDPKAKARRRLQDMAEALHEQNPYLRGLSPLCAPLLRCAFIKIKISHTAELPSSFST